MKKINQILLAILVIAFAMPTLQSCKKGENDPMLSLKSRKARLTGEWKLSEGTVTELEGTGSTTTVYTETMKTETELGETPAITPYTETITIEKDGTFESTNVSGTSIYTLKGVWFWAEGNKELETGDKEVLVLSITSITTAGGVSTYTGFGDSNQQFLKIDKLSGKEMIITIEESSSSTGSVSSKTGTKTYIQE